jgi:hypothetical protein
MSIQLYKPPDTRSDHQTEIDTDYQNTSHQHQGTSHQAQAGTRTAEYQNTKCQNRITVLQKSTSLKLIQAHCEVMNCSNGSTVSLKTFLSKNSFQLHEKTLERKRVQRQSILTWAVWHFATSLTTWTTTST